MRLGLPHTNYNNLAEHLLVMTAGYYQWETMARAIGTPLAALRTNEGGEVYATFFYVEETFPDDQLINTFALDHDLIFVNVLRGFRNISVEGQLLFNYPRRLLPALTGDEQRAGTFTASQRASHPFIRFGNVFINPDLGNARLKMASPANGDFAGLTPLPNEENAYQVTRGALESGTLGLLDEMGPWTPVPAEPHLTEYRLNPDRDTNGAGLVYFANYIAFMDVAERAAMHATGGFSPDEVSFRALKARRLAYYGNVDVGDALLIHVRVMRGATDTLGFAYRITRKSDGQLICLSESVKRVSPPPPRGRPDTEW